MTGHEDARFEDAGEAPLRLRAFDAEDLAILSSLVQDSVFPAAEMKWLRKERRFAILLNRFRWEDAAAAAARRRSFERVQSVLSVEDVMKVQTQGAISTDREVVMSVLSIAFEPGPDGTGRVVLNLAGDGAIALEVEALEVALRDVTRPYRAPTGHRPDHGPDHGPDHPE